MAGWRPASTHGYQKRHQGRLGVRAERTAAWWTWQESAMAITSLVRPLARSSLEV